MTSKPSSWSLQCNAVFSNLVVHLFARFGFRFIILAFRVSCMAHTLFSSDGCRSAGLPQYGQLGHGTDNEVIKCTMGLNSCPFEWSSDQDEIGSLCPQWYESFGGKFFWTQLANFVAVQFKRRLSSVGVWGTASASCYQLISNKDCHKGCLWQQSQWFVLALPVPWIPFSLFETIDWINTNFEHRCQ
jgi:hypothetical protein